MVRSGMATSDTENFEKEISSNLEAVRNRLSEAQTARLRRHLADEGDAVARGDAAAATRLSADFHRLLAGMSGNRVLAEVLGDLICRSALVSPEEPQQEAARRSHRVHLQILDALAAGDATQATRRMTDHLKPVGAALAPQDPPSIAPWPSHPLAP
jgi:DNA-binding GntR family transcriptional regulator